MNEQVNLFFKPLNLLQGWYDSNSTIKPTEQLVEEKKPNSLHQCTKSLREGDSDRYISPIPEGTPAECPEGFRSYNDFIICDVLYRLGHADKIPEGAILQEALDNMEESELPEPIEEVVNIEEEITKNTTEMIGPASDYTIYEFYNEHPEFKKEMDKIEENSIDPVEEIAFGLSSIPMELEATPENDGTLESTDKITIIEAGDARYCSEIGAFAQGYPQGFINKKITDTGGTYHAVNCPVPYLILVPYRDLADSICADPNNKMEVHKFYGGIDANTTREYLENTRYSTPSKIVCTWDSLPRLMPVLEEFGLKSTLAVLIDEWENLIQQLNFRFDAISNLMNNLEGFAKVSFLSATPIKSINIGLDPVLFPKYEISWSEKAGTTIQPIRMETNNPTTGVKNLITMFNSSTGLSMKNADGENQVVEELYVFVSNVATISQICDDLDLRAKDVRIICSKTKENQKKISPRYQIETVLDAPKRINFLTRKCFAGCNFYSSAALTVVVSDSNRSCTLIDISTTMHQIAGRIRNSETSKNAFRNTILHIYKAKDTGVMSPEEFAEFMADLDAYKDRSLGYWRMWDNQLKSDYSRDKDYSPSLLTWDANHLCLTYSPLRRAFLCYNHRLKVQYSSGLNVTKEYLENKDKFDLIYQEMYVKFDSIINPVTTSTTLAPDELQSVLNAIKPVAGFISAKEVKSLLQAEFEKRGIKVKAKGTMILDAADYEVEAKVMFIAGKTTKGFLID